jgi:hypothetical protein
MAFSLFNYSMERKEREMLAFSGLPACLMLKRMRIGTMLMFSNLEKKPVHKGLNLVKNMFNYRYIWCEFCSPVERKDGRW